jgi:hypothetical protein
VLGGRVALLRGGGLRRILREGQRHVTLTDARLEMIVPDKTWTNTLTT